MISVRHTALAAAFVMSALPQVGNSEPGPEAQRLVQQGLAAKELFPGYTDLCQLDKRIRNVNAPRDRSAQRSATPRKPRKARPDRQPLAPMQVFDNLYFLGTHSVSAWLYGTPEGYLLIDSLNTDEEAETYILGGMETLGLDPAAITAILVTHAHGDHYGGADYLAEKLGVEIMMSRPDWRLAAITPPHPRFGPAPQQGITVEDGQELRFGTSSLTVNLTPGHTPGTISPVFAVSDHGEQHHAALWGGTGFNFGPMPEIFRLYAQSAAKLDRAARAADVDVFLSNHPRRDGSVPLMAELAQRAPDAPHPFVLEDKGYALFDMLESCATAQALRLETASSE